MHLLGNFSRNWSYGANSNELLNVSPTCLCCGGCVKPKARGRGVKFAQVLARL
ncbi:unnamed protein product [Pararhodospirillum photometricum DSM 122]|uniref:Uncharacterized protein n=1 Tax=Pararhodospirillum photometricum DSM 122 TaxID=1150469 RepID=H6SL15_PARPM|nr:unnamed protein product [Pararhodospirillum photometricum DSM 122]